jgi:hypothetical protein
MTSPFLGKTDIAALMQVNALLLSARFNQDAIVRSIADGRVRKDNPD